MRMLLVLFILICTEARRRRPASLQTETGNLNRNSKSDDIDVSKRNFHKSVDFGHVYKDSSDSRHSKLQADLSDSDMEKPHSPQQVREILQEVDSDINWMRKSDTPLGFANPRDSTQYYEKYKKQNGKNINENERESLKKAMKMTNRSRPMWINFPLLLQRNLSPPDYRSPSYYQEKSMREPPRPSVIDNRKMNQNETNKAKYFSGQTFDLIEEEEKHIGVNWTTCEEFSKGATFHPDDIINLDWLPFFIWSTRDFDTSNVHKFSYPTKKLVEDYEKKFDPLLTTKIDWEQPKLLLKEVKDTLLIAGDRRGLFYGIPYIDLPLALKDVRIPVITMRLKIVDTYLALMYCDDHFAMIMAILGEGPETFEEKRREAAILKFTGIGNPAVRDVEGEKLRAKYELEKKRIDEEQKYINVERQFHRFD